MKYKSVDEINTISLTDAKIECFKLSEDGSVLNADVSGAVVLASNAANEYYTDKYTDIMQLAFYKPVIETILLEGHKYYDADNKLVEQVPDIPVNPENYSSLMKSFAGCYVFYGGTPKETIVSSYLPDNAKRKTEGLKCYQMIIDVEEESYVLSFYYEKVVASWEHFLNKADMG